MLFESEVERLHGLQSLDEVNFAKPLLYAASLVLSPVVKTIGKMRAGYAAVRATALIWKEAQEESGENLSPSPLLREAVLLTRLSSGVAQEVDENRSNALPQSESRLSFQSRNLDEALSVVTVVSFILAIIGGLPLIFKGLEKISGSLRMRRLTALLHRVHHVLHAIEERVIDVVIPDKLSYALYRKTWKRGFKVTPEILSFDEYVQSEYAKTKVEKTMFSILLVYFAWHGILGILEAGATLLGAAEATATTVKAIEIARGIKDASQIVRGVA